MKVIDFIALLQTMPPESEVAMYSYDNEWAEAAFSPVEVVEAREVKVFAGYAPKSQGAAQLTRDETWTLLYYKDSEYHTYQTDGMVYGRSDC